MKWAYGLILTIMLVISGCSGTDNNNSATTPFVGGTTGLLLSFAEGAPPEQVYDGGDFPFGIDVILKNDGEYTIPADRAHVTISGILATDFNLVPNDFHLDVDEELVKTDKDSEGNVLQGTIYHAEYDDLEYMGYLEGNQQFTIRADVCYEYGTTITSKICIRDDVLDIDDGVCVVGEAKAAFNSGAPVQITSFEEQATGSNTISFTFNIEKKGNGDIFMVESENSDGEHTEQCQDERKYRDKVYVDVDFGSSTLNDVVVCPGLKNTPSGQDSDRQGFVTLYSGVRPIRCSVDISNPAVSGDYEKVLNIKLKYDYQENINTGLLIKHATNE